MNARTLLALALLVGCATPPPADEPEVPDDGIVELAPRQLLIRLSLDLRGLHPSEEELAFFEANPTTYDQFVDRYLHDPRFPKRMEDLYARVFLTRTGETYFDPSEAGLGVLDPDRVADSVGDEPIKLVGHLVADDLPWSQLVLADYTMADPILAAMWDLDYPRGETGWQPAAYKDGRPQAGVLSMTTMWLRYPSAGVNSNRHRANAVTTTLLCDDYLSRPVSFARTQIDALTSGDPEDVIRNTQTCQACHSSLDPLAANFFGFWWEIEGGLAEQTLYRPEDETEWTAHANIPPGFYGRPTANLLELAGAIAEDPRFADCAVENFFEGLTQRDTSDADWSELRAHHDAFVGGGLVVRDLVRSIVSSREYKAAAVLDPDKAERVVTLKGTTPDVLEDVVHQVTGYRWEFDGRPALERNALGLSVLAGGIDGRYTRTPSYDPSVGLVFVQERLAQSAAWHVATHDLDPERTDDAKLLRYVTIADTPESAQEAFDGQIRELYRDVTGLPLPPDATEPDDLMTVWKQLYSVNADPVASWAGVLSVVLRDPSLILY